MAAPSVHGLYSPASGSSQLPNLGQDKQRFFALIQGPEEEFEVAKALLAENEPLRKLLIRNNSFDPFIQGLLENKVNRNRFLYIRRICALMREHECMTPFGEIAEGLSLIRYKRIVDAIAHIEELCMDDQIYPRILNQVGVYRAEGQGELAALFENFAAHMASVKRSGTLADVIHPSLADLGKRV
jgi:hypothetical protein